MIELTLTLETECPWPIVMQNHPVLKTYDSLPENTRLATAPDFFNQNGKFYIGKPYFWKRVSSSVFNASRTTANCFDDDFKVAIISKRVWILNQ